MLPAKIARVYAEALYALHSFIRPYTGRLHQLQYAALPSPAATALLPAPARQQPADAFLFAGSGTAHAADARAAVQFKSAAVQPDSSASEGADLYHCSRC